MFVYNSYIFVLKAVFRLASVTNRKAEARLKLLASQKISPKISNKRRIWIHAASAGEFEQVLPLVEQLKRNFELEIYVSFFSISGIEMFENHPIIDHCILLPFDDLKNAEAFIDSIQPKLVIWTKYEFWLHHLSEIKRRGIPLFLVNANLNQLLKKPWPYSKVINDCLPLFTSIFSSTKPDIPFHKVSFHLLQDTKWESALNVSQKTFKDSVVEHFAKDRKLIIAGSTHAKDLDLLAKSIESTDFSSTAWIIVPHETDEISLQQVEKKFASQKVVRYSHSNFDSADILIVDKKGLLKYLYRYADLAYVGGGLEEGVHNLLEAAVYGVPVICGPKITKAPEAYILKTAGLLNVITSESELETAIKEAFAQNGVSFQEKAKRCFEENLKNSPSAIITEEIKKFLS